MTAAILMIMIGLITKAIIQMDTAAIIPRFGVINFTGMPIIGIHTIGVVHFTGQMIHFSIIHITDSILVQDLTTDMGFIIMVILMADTGIGIA
jgi:hypothetical protein